MVELVLTVSQSVNYVMYHNGMEALLAAEVVNDGEATGEMTAVLRSEPVFFRECSARVHPLRPGEKAELSGLCMALDPNTVAGITERTNARVILELSDDDGVVAAAERDTALLPFNYWPGDDFPESVAAFVTPNAASMDAVKAAASDILGSWGRNPSLEGYQGDRDRVKLMGAAAFAALSRLNLTYVNPPAGFESRGQRIRMPDEVVAIRQGTCLDLSVLYASVLESIGLNTLVFLVRGHAMAGFWLSDDTTPQLQTFDSSFFTKQIRNREMLAVECTLLTNSSAADFEQACDLALMKLDEVSEFCYAVDVRRARGTIAPLPTARREDGSIVVERAERRTAASAPSAVGEVYEDAGSNRSLSRADKWSRELLDITNRNNLVSMKTGKKVVPVLSAGGPAVEDRLASGREFQLLDKPQEWDGGPRYGEGAFESESYVGNYGAVFADDLDKGRLRVPLPPAEAERTLRGIYRNATKELEENGCNSLFMTFGILRWREGRSSPPRYAPLVMVPVEMRKGRSGFSVRRLDEETLFNVTAAEMLRTNFGIELPSLDPLPADDNGVNVEQVLQTVRRHIVGMDGWEVLDGVTLGVFSFSQFVMWNDLVNNMGRLRGNALVESLVSETTYPEHGGLEGDCEPYDLCLTVPADSSQIRAVRALADGRTFVMHGPPGTGKSQTITNMICNELYNGRTVLFVAEKLAALEVVQRRLEEVGIGNHCLEMHSNKSEKSKVLQQLASSLEKARQYDPEDLERTVAQLEASKSRLDAYVTELHRRRSWGLSAYECISRYEACGCDSPLDIGFPSEKARAMTAEGVADLEEAISNACHSFARVRDMAAEPFTRIRTRSTAASVNDDVRTGVSGVRRAGRDLDDARAKVAAAGLPVDASDTEAVSAFYRAASGLRDNVCSDPDAGRLPEAVDGVLGPAEEALRAFGLLGSACGASPEERRGILGLTSRARSGLDALIAAGHLGAGCDASRALDEMDGILSDAGALHDDYASVTSVWRPSAFAFDEGWGVAARWKEADGAGLLRRKKAHAEFMEAAGPHLKSASATFESLAASVQTLSAVSAKVVAADRRLERFREEGLGDRCLAELRSLRGDAAGAAAFMVAYGVEPRNLARTVSDARRTAGLAEDLAAKAGAWGRACSALSATLDLDEGPDEDFTALCDALQPYLDRIYDWAAWNAYSGAVSDMGLGDAVRHIEEGRGEELVQKSAGRALYRTMVNLCREESEALRMFSADTFEGTVEKFRGLDSAYTDLCRNLLKYRLYSNVPQIMDGVQGSEASTLYKAINSSRMRKSIRKLLSEIPTILPRICPCFLMSPLSVAQYVTGDYPPFDTVIFDESSQITTCKAVGALGRGRNAVIAGDSKQLPPTSFFQRKTGDDDEGEEVDIDSFLDDCLAANIPETYLEWHYRSRHESLIAFSNRMFYGNKMLTFPSPNDQATKVGMRRVRGVYHRGRGVNPEEAKAVTEEIRRRASDPALRDRSIGVIAFSVRQQECIQDALDDAMKADKGFFDAFNRMPEGVFIKNLETVQGDERDVILFSIGYGPDADGVVYQNFGPINRDGGGRRLNVAVSRARDEMVVFSSISSNDVKITPTSRQGLRSMKEFLLFAENGGRFGPTSDAPRSGGSEILNGIAGELRGRGYDVHFDVGCSEFRVDVAVVDPRDPEEYVLGILGDGDSYRASANTRDREYARADVLSRLGWSLVHVWSLEWYFQRRQAVEKIAAAVEDAIENGPRIPAAAPPAEELEEDFLPEPPPARPADSRAVPYDGGVAPEGFVTNPNYATSNRRFAGELSSLIIGREAPIDENHLLDLYKQAVGIKRLTEEKRESVTAYVRDAHPHEAVGSFVTYWGDVDRRSYRSYRVPAEGCKPRSITSVALPEILNAIVDVLEKSGSVDADSIVPAVAKALGYGRAGAVVNERVGEALGIALGRDLVKESGGRYRVRGAGAVTTIF